MIESSNTYLIPILCLTLVIVIICFSYFFSNKQKIIRTLTKLPIKQVGRIQPNEFAKFAGKAAAIEAPLTAPYSNRKCVFYKIKIDVRVSNGKRTSWKNLVNDEKIQDFFLEKTSFKRQSSSRAKTSTGKTKREICR